MTSCAKCGAATTFCLELVRDGRVHECVRCRCGLRVVHDEGATEIPASISGETHVLLVRIACRNAYVFDRTLFSRFVRRVAAEFERSPRHVVLDLEPVGLLAESCYPALRRVRGTVLARGKRFVVVQRSPLFRTLARSFDPGIEWEFAADAAAALASLPAEAVAAATV